MQQRDLATFGRGFGSLFDQIEATDQAGRPLDRDEAALEAIDLLVEASLAEQKLLAVGYGASAPVARLVVEELAPTVGLRSDALHEPRPGSHRLQAAAADPWEVPLSPWVESGDVLFAVSSSVQPGGLTESVRRARRQGCRVCTLTSASADPALRAAGRINFWVPSDVVGLARLAHFTLVEYFTAVATTIVPGLETARRGATESPVMQRRVGSDRE